MQIATDIHPDAEDETVAAEVQPSVGAVTSVAFMITQAMRRQLRERGVGEDQLRTMTPAAAHRWLRASE